MKFDVMWEAVLRGLVFLPSDPIPSLIPCRQQVN